jgi:protease-4
MRALRGAPRRRRFATLAVVAVSLALPGCVLVTGNDLSPFTRRAQPLREHVLAGEGRDRVLLIDLSGEISDQESERLGVVAREGTVSLVDAALRAAEKDKRVKAVILRVNSPGGTVTASDILYTRLMAFKAERQIPLYAVIMDIGASGAYYASLAADQIIAHPTAVVGSIGVIFQSVSLAGLLGKVGVTNQTVKTGEMKDLGSPLTTMSAEQREIVEKLIGEMHQRFVGLVRERRPTLTAEMDRVMRDGRVFSAGQALAGGLVDDVDYLEGAIERAKRAAGLGTATVIEYRQPDDYARGIYARGGTSPLQVNLLNLETPRSAAPRFLYQWIP